MPPLRVAGIAPASAKKGGPRGTSAAGGPAPAGQRRRRGGPTMARGRRRRVGWLGRLRPRRRQGGRPAQSALGRDALRHTGSRDPGHRLPRRRRRLVVRDGGRSRGPADAVSVGQSVDPGSRSGKLQFHCHPIIIPDDGAWSAASGAAMTFSQGAVRPLSAVLGAVDAGPARERRAPRGVRQGATKTWTPERLAEVVIRIRAPGSISFHRPSIDHHKGGLWRT